MTFKEYYLKEWKSLTFIILFVIGAQFKLWDPDDPLDPAWMSYALELFMAVILFLVFYVRWKR